jgi:CheY-like chemotaxis protein
VLVADDEEDIRVLLRLILEAAGLQVVAEAVDGEDALAHFDRLDPPPIPAVVILDNRMPPGRDGIEVAIEMLRRLPTQRIILFSAFLTKELEEEARAVGVERCVTKWDADLLPALIVRVPKPPPAA